MRRMSLASTSLLCACAGSMVRAPKHIPDTGMIECTDTMETPIAATIGAALSAGVLAYSLTHEHFTVENGGIIWAPLSGVLTIDFLVSAGLGHSYAVECREAKRRGSELAALAQSKANARAEAGTLWKRAAAAARVDDCMTVRALDPQIRALDVELHDVVFARDVAIARCLVTRE